MNKILLPLTLALFFISSCSKEPTSSLDGPKEYFSKHKAGTSPDYGIIKWNDPKDHVISIHGFVDDLKSCIEVQDALNASACKETGGETCMNPYSCIPLNH